MRVLVACEFSGVVTKAFRERGHEAFSCDLLPTEGNPDWHIEHNVLNLFHGNNGEGWDLIIAHPPCTYLCNSGVRWLNPGDKINLDRYNKMLTACDFFKKLYWSSCPRVCVENPIMHRHAKTILKTIHEIPEQTQTIQMWEHGEPETKRTGLWLRGLPELKPSCDVHEQMMNRNTAQRNRVHYASPGPNRWKERSRTLAGVANAMAEQWGNL